MNRRLIICFGVVFSSFILVLFFFGVLWGIDDLGILFTDSVYQFLLLLVVVNLLLILLVLHIFLKYVKCDFINEDSQRESMVREYYHYSELSDPPTINT